MKRFDRKIKKTSKTLVFQSVSTVLPPVIWHLFGGGNVASLETRGVATLPVLQRAVGATGVSCDKELTGTSR